MCGIAGVWSPEPLAEGTDARLRAMADVLVHRGPDGEGVWTDGQVGLSHRRLAIIDLSPAAAQPMSDAEGVIHVVHNGEVYNFPQLREELMALGYQFKSRSDTEVIVNGYKQWGEAVVGRLRGMFAFAIWDSRNRRLLLARDRAGQKPLYYTWRDGTLIFGSEIKAILAWPGVPREPDLTAIHHYLTFMYVPAPFTAFAGIRRLAPAHTMVVEADGASRIERYWSLPAPEAARPRPRAELAEEITARLDEAVRLRMISDVPLGAFLSGGVDSAAVVASMARVSDRPVKTFTIGFAHDQYDERRYARMVADRFATDHNEFVVEADAVSVLPQIVWHYGEPFADSSAIPTWYVSELTRRHVTVALNGDGGDESFLGYPRYTGCRVGAWADALPGPARTLMAALGRALPFETSQRRLLRYARRFLVDADAYLVDRIDEIFDGDPDVILPMMSPENHSWDYNNCQGLNTGVMGFNGRTAARDAFLRDWYEAIEGNDEWLRELVALKGAGEAAAHVAGFGLWYSRRDGAYAFRRELNLHCARDVKHVLPRGRELEAVAIAIVVTAGHDGQREESEQGHC